jgi:hypothetical protein
MGVGAAASAIMANDVCESLTFMENKTRGDGQKSKEIAT